MSLPPRSADVTLRALTWNVGRLFPHPKIHKMAAERILRKRHAGLSAHAHDSHLPHIAKVIRDLDPDIITLQEIGSRLQLESLLSELENAYTSSLSDDADVYDRYVVILTKLGLSASAHQIRTTSGRAALAVHVPKHNLVFVGLHADAIHYQRRTGQLEDILRWLTPHRDRRIVLAGDFNLDLSVVGPRIRKANLSVYRTITQGCNFTDMTLDCGNTTSYLPRRLDYVFSNIDPRHVLGLSVLRQERKGLMDHHPIVVDFQF